MPRKVFPNFASYKIGNGEGTHGGNTGSDLPEGFMEAEGANQPT